ncbi:MAG: hypothetical protein GX605_02995 [Chloroflexi bacterium]|nr:hypothetical protein [Chloroflexota bacterium]
MPNNVLLSGLVTFFHDLFTAIWIGGLFCLAGMVLPAARQVLGMGPQAKQLMEALQRRLSVAVYVSIVGLGVTGLLLARREPAFAGLFRLDNTYTALLSAKHLLMLLMMAIAVLRSRALRPKGANAGPQVERLKGALLFLNLVLGVLVLLLSGLAAAVSSAGTIG